MTTARVDTRSCDAEHSGLCAETEFLLNWMRAVQLAGPTYFGDGTLASFRAARSKWDLCPNVELIESAALVSVYDDATGGDLLHLLNRSASTAWPISACLTCSDAPCWPT